MPYSLYGNHPHASVRKSDIAHKKKASRGAWRSTDGVVYPVTITRIAGAR